MYGPPAGSVIEYFTQSVAVGQLDDDAVTTDRVADGCCTLGINGIVKVEGVVVPTVSRALSATSVTVPALALFCDVTVPARAADPWVPTVAA